MFKYIFGGTIAVAMIAAIGATTVPQPAHAGCVTGALVGGLAGHFLGHHGFAGAAAGCAGGALLKHHQDNVQQRQQYDQNQLGRQHNPNYGQPVKPY